MSIKERLNVEAMFALQNTQYAEFLLMDGVIPAGQEKPLKVNISSLGDFLVTRITGTYTTLEEIEEQIVDTGVSYLRGKIIDNARQRQLTSDYIPLDLILSSGRRKSSLAANVLADIPAPQLFYPIEFSYLFSKNSDILVYFKNTSNVDQEVSICFHGYRIMR